MTEAERQRKHRALLAAVDPPAASDEAWREGAVCAGVHFDVFFPEVNSPTSNRAAKTICAGCPVREPCREYAIATHQNEGVWGGMATAERRALRRLRLREARRLVAL